MAKKSFPAVEPVPAGPPTVDTPAVGSPAVVADEPADFLPEPATAPAPEVRPDLIVPASQPEPKKAGKPRWIVELGCPTPLRSKRLVVEADTETEAKEAYCRHNGISGSSHDWSIRRAE